VFEKNKTKQNKTKQNKTKQNKTKQNYEIHHIYIFINAMAGALPFN
jgi:hypothetical protein